MLTTTEVKKKLTVKLTVKWQPRMSNYCMVCSMSLISLHEKVKNAVDPRVIGP